MPIPDPIRGSRWSMRVLRNAPALVFLLMFFGGIALAVGGFLDDTSPRPDAFVIVGGRKAPDVVRFDLPDGWTVKYQAQKNRAPAVGVFTPEGTFAFEVERVPPADSAEAFAAQNGKAGATVEQRPVGGETVIAAREGAADVWTGKWGAASHGRVERATYFAGRDRPCLRFTIRVGDVDAHEPRAFSLFQVAQILPAGDPRRDNLATDADMAEVRWWVLRVGGWMLGTGLVLTLFIPFLALYFVVHEAAAGSPHLRAIDRPPLPEKAEAQLERLERGREGLEAFGFEHAGWFRLDDFDETHVSAWRHRDRGTVAFVQYLPLNSTCKLRILTWFPDGWILVSSTRLTDLSYAPKPPAYCQVRNGATTTELWSWHLEAEELFQPRSSATRPMTETPQEVYVRMLRRAAKVYTEPWLWFVRFNPFGELWRMKQWNGVSVREQIDRGRVIDPALTFPDPDAR